MQWYEIDTTGCELVLDTDTGRCYKTPQGNLIVTDHEGRIPMPDEDRERYWVMPVAEKVAYILSKIKAVDASAKWGAERLANLGLIPEQHMVFDVANILRGLYPDGEDTTVEQAMESLRSIGVKV